MERPLSGRVRIGDFELDLKTGELSSAVDRDQKVLLREQPFQVLRMLIERGGTIVTREEIRRKLWPNSTIVDFDHSINVAIGILRKVLGDSASNPTYIETLARRGYRLAVAVEFLETTTEVHRPETPIVQPPAGAAALIGKKVSHYRVLRIIGGGGMGMVFEAEDLKLGRRVALKFLPEELASDPVALRRFEREAQTASALNHPNICTIYGVEEYEGQPFIAMELLEGDTLLHRIDSSAPKEILLDTLLDVAIQICNGLQAAHDKEIIHRDIKPGNIFLTKQGHVKILDFGLAKLAESEEVAERDIGTSNIEPLLNNEQITTDSTAESIERISPGLTRPGTTPGTAGYMSPEQLRKEKLDARTDLFSFGLVIYEMAAGRRAFTGETAALVQDAILNRTPNPAHDLNSAVARELDAIITKALEKDRSRRYQSAAQMRDDLERVRSETEPARRRPLRWLAAAALLVLVASGTWTYLGFRNKVTLSPSDTIVLAVSNQTGDPVFNDALYTSLRTGLEQTPYLNVLAANKVGEALRTLHLSEDPTKMTPQTATEVCVRSNSKMVIAGSIAEAGNGFHIELDGINCQSGKTIAQVLNEVPSRTLVVHVLGVSAAQLRAKLGEPDASVARFNKPLDEATSASPEALQLLTDGYRHHLTGDVSGAVPYYQRAIEVDPDFAMAHVALAFAHSSLGKQALAVASAKKAYELRTRMTERARFHAEDVYYDLATGEQEKTCGVLSQWAQTFPDDFIAHNNFAVCLQSLGQLDRSLAEAREAVRLLPSSVSYGWVIRGAIATDRIDEAKAAYADAESRKFDNAKLRDYRVQIAFLQKDNPAMQEQWSWAVGKPGADYDFLYGRAQVESYHGQYRDYRRFLTQAKDLAAKEGSLLDADLYNSDYAMHEAEAGNSAQARRIAGNSLKGVQNRATQLVLALALARAGDNAPAQKLADTISQEAPLNTMVQNYSLPTIRAAIKLNMNDPAGAVEILRATAKYELAMPGGFDSLYPVYIRGLAYLRMGEGRLATTEFQKLLDHPGIIGRFVIGALSHLQMARAQKMAGNEAAARKSYEDFLTLWKDADADLPVYQQAKAEYAELGKG
jgi:serine/threonine protein kinase